MTDAQDITYTTPISELIHKYNTATNPVTRSVYRAIIQERFNYD